MMTMRTLVIFATALFCVQAVHVPFILSGSPDSSEEEISILVPVKGQSLPGVGQVKQPTLQAIKVKVPHYASASLKQQLIDEALAIRGITQPSIAPKAPVVRGARQAAATTAATQVVSEAATAASAATVVPAVGSATEAAVATAVPVAQKSN